MISIRIGAEEKELSSANESWINQAINGANAPVCVQVSIQQPSVQMVLATPTCARGVGGRAPNELEAFIFELWDKRGLNRPDFHGGNLISFLAQVPK